MTSKLAWGPSPGIPATTRMLAATARGRTLAEAVGRLAAAGPGGLVALWPPSLVSLADPAPALTADAATLDLLESVLPRAEVVIGAAIDVAAAGRTGRGRTDRLEDRLAAPRQPSTGISAGIAASWPSIIGTGPEIPAPSVPPADRSVCDRDGAAPPDRRTTRGTDGAAALDRLGRLAASDEWAGRRVASVEWSPARSPSTPPGARPVETGVLRRDPAPDDGAPMAAGTGSPGDEPAAGAYEPGARTSSPTATVRVDPRSRTTPRSGPAPDPRGGPSTLAWAPGDRVGPLDRASAPGERVGPLDRPSAAGPGEARRTDASSSIADEPAWAPAGRAEPLARLASEATAVRSPVGGPAGFGHLQADPTTGGRVDPLELADALDELLAQEAERHGLDGRVP